MKKITQSIIGSGEGKEKTGTCFRASLASIFECQESDMRPFERMDLYGSNWHLIFMEDIEKLGFEYIGIGKPKEIADYEGVDGYVVACGASPRGFKRGHAVVYYKGELAHDPHPSGDGILELWEFYKIIKKN